jgi:hypothetical protein
MKCTRYTALNKFKISTTIHQNKKMIKKGVRYYLEPPVPPGYCLLGVNIRGGDYDFILVHNNENIRLNRIHTLHLFECYEKHSGRHFIFAKRRIPSLQEICIFQYRNFGEEIPNIEDIFKNGRLIDPPTYFTGTFYTPLLTRQIRFTFDLAQDEEGKWFITTEKQKEIDNLDYSSWLLNISR